MFDYIMAGAGSAESVVASHLAVVKRKNVLTIDKRGHVTGNAFDFYDHAGTLFHNYGPQMFRTNSAHVLNYLSKFTEWRNYQHNVLNNTHGRYVPIPINLKTINSLYGMKLKTIRRTGTINYLDEHDFTRIVEFKYLTGQKHKKTSVVYEFPKSDRDPYP